MPHTGWFRLIVVSKGCRRHSPCDSCEYRRDGGRRRTSGCGRLVPLRLQSPLPHHDCRSLPRRSLPIVRSCSPLLGNGYCLRMSSRWVPLRIGTGGCKACPNVGRTAWATQRRVAAIGNVYVRQAKAAPLTSPAPSRAPSPTAMQTTGPSNSSSGR